MSGSRPLVALSIGDSPDLGRLGYGPEHVDALAIRLADALLSLGYDIASGGVLRSMGFTETLQGVVKSHEKASTAEAAVPGPRMVNYLSWPYLHALGASQVANLLGMCRFVQVEPPEAAGMAAPARGFESLTTIYHAARASSEMRRRMAVGATATDGSPVPGADARIVLGGKVQGWTGILPGVAEEVLTTLEAGKPVYVLGCFGGAARRVGEALLEEELPAGLTKGFHDGEERFQRTCAAYEAQGHGELIAGRFAELGTRLRSALVQYRRSAGDDRWVENGLSVEENRELLRSEHVPTLKRLVHRGLSSILRC